MQVVLNLPNKTATRIGAACDRIEDSPERVIDRLVRLRDILINEHDPYVYDPEDGAASCHFCNELQGNPHLSVCVWGGLERVLPQ